MLVLMQDNKIVQNVQEGGWLDLPNGDRMSPAVAGWSSGPYSLRTAPPDPTPTEDELVAELCSNLRTQRDALLVAVVDPVLCNPVRWAEMPVAKKAEWTAYRAALLDVPQQTKFPETVVWPEQPSK